MTTTNANKWPWGERPSPRRNTVIAGTCLAFLMATTAFGQKPLQYHGGPVLSSFTIYPLYYGTWAAADITAEQDYLKALASYMSGQNAPAGQPRAAPRRKQAACHTAHAVCALLSFGSPTTVGHEGELQREGTRP